jgi:diaminopimelate epimerase
MNFVKMHGLGNDYVFINCFETKASDPARLARVMSERRTGVGSDGLILIMPSASCDFRMRMFNADGTEAETCGNGIRCFAKYVYEQGLTNRKEFVIETLAGPTRVWLTTEGNTVTVVRCDMGVPRLLRSEIPMLGEEGEVVEEPLRVADSEYKVTCVSMGNPHAVIFVEDVQTVPLETIGPQIENHPKFPNRTNVEFVQVCDRKNIRMRVWERGSGETLACGSGCCAAAIASARTDRMGRTVTVHLELGSLKIEWMEDGHVYMEGPATRVFDGEWLEGR